MTKLTRSLTKGAGTRPLSFVRSDVTHSHPSSSSFCTTNTSPLPKLKVNRKWGNLSAHYGLCCSFSTVFNTHTHLMLLAVLNPQSGCGHKSGLPSAGSRQVHSNLCSGECPLAKPANALSLNMELCAVNLNKRFSINIDKVKPMSFVRIYGTMYCNNASKNKRKDKIKQT